MDVWAQKGNPEWAIAVDAVRLDVVTVDSGSRTCCCVHQLLLGPSVREEGKTIFIRLILLE